MRNSIPMIEPRRRSPFKRGAGAACTEGRNEVEDGARRCGPRSRPARLRSTAGLDHRDRWQAVDDQGAGARLRLLDRLANE